VFIRGLFIAIAGAEQFRQQFPKFFFKFSRNILIAQVCSVVNNVRVEFVVEQIVEFVDNRVNVPVIFTVIENGRVNQMFGIFLCGDLFWLRSVNSGQSLKSSFRLRPVL
jgi:hypothetical protein